MKIDLFLEKIEIGFQSLIGFSIVGLLGMLLGIFFFSLLLYIISYEKKDKKISNLPVNGLSDIGDPVEANINLARSFIEMSEFEKAYDCLKKITVHKDDLTTKQLERFNFLKNKIEESKNG
ncbi:MAG: hypothetical protein CMD69_00665 [Gammaproteobacteria bacterium]|nr:hypothetical protein [Gammaproteobacteria bacterium]MBI81394.1 hypothetical protein [Gammaproteobacteria bacterium]|tara:strand:+ start:13113 stop:13475 length:363 start_codon:yes stop_codon:yes gene_type:complete